MSRNVGRIAGATRADQVGLDPVAGADLMTPEDHPLRRARELKYRSTPDWDHGRLNDDGDGTDDDDGGAGDREPPKPLRPLDSGAAPTVAIDDLLPDIGPILRTFASK